MRFRTRCFAAMALLLAAAVASSCGDPVRRAPSPTAAGASGGLPPGGGGNAPGVAGAFGGQVGQSGLGGGASGGGASGADAGGGSGRDGGGGDVAGGGGGGGSGGVPSGPPRFVKKRLSSQFYSEGINHGDLNRDGQTDIIAGPYWYPGPTFDEARAFRAPRAMPFDVAGDSDCYAIFVHDLNQDEWLDVLSLRLPGGAEAVWYENPKGGSDYWTERVAFSQVDNESATFTDVDGDGKPELVTQSNGYGGWAQPNWSDPTQPWTFRAVTARGDWERYTHGMGVGDVNADGRKDLLFAEGWWEQPSGGSTPWVSHAAGFWGQEASGESYGGAQMFVDDVDGDGDNDVVTSLQAHGWGLAWFERTVAGFSKHLVMNTRSDEAEYGVAFAQLHALDLVDLDGDGLRDIVTGKRKGAHGNGLGAELNAPAVLYWFQLIREPGEPPRYEPHLLDSEAGVGTQVVAADVNDDERPDLLTAARAGAFVFLSD